MKAKERTLEEVRLLGLELLARELGPVDFIRFMQLFDNGSGNYTEERYLWLDQIDGPTLLEKIYQRRTKPEDEPTSNDKQPEADAD